MCLFSYSFVFTVLRDLGFEEEVELVFVGIRIVWCFCERGRRGEGECILKVGGRVVLVAGGMKAQRKLVEEEPGETEAQPEHKKMKPRAITEVKCFLVPEMGYLPLLEDDERLDEVSNFIAKNYDREFAVATTFDVTFIRRLAYRGFLPMAGFTFRGPTMTPKLHTERCVLTFGNLHVSRKVRRTCKLFEITTDHCFERVIEECNKQHGEMSWLCAPLVKSFIEIFRASHEVRSSRS